MNQGNQVKPVPGIPQSATYHYNFNDRHIINDAFNKIIYIQVGHIYTGDLKMEEYDRMKAGMFWEYLPEHLLPAVKQMIDAGYQVRPMWINGYNTQNGFIVYQMDDPRVHSGVRSLVDGKGFNVKQ